VETAIQWTRRGKDQRVARGLVPSGPSHSRIRNRGHCSRSLRRYRSAFVRYLGAPSDGQPTRRGSISAQTTYQKEGRKKCKYKYKSQLEPALGRWARPSEMEQSGSGHFVPIEQLRGSFWSVRTRPAAAAALPPLWTSLSSTATCSGLYQQLGPVLCQIRRSSRKL